MGKHYCHIIPEARLKIHQLLLQGFSIQEIALQVGVHRATLYRELGRNSCRLGYRPDWASQQALERRRNCKMAKLDKHQELNEFVMERLKIGWSPEQIAGRANLDAGYTVISHESIYQYVYSAQGQALKLFKYLRKQRRFRYPRIKRRKYRGAESKKSSIKDRAANIELRQIAGHWEGDLVHFRKTRTNLFTRCAPWRAKRRRGVRGRRGLAGEAASPSRRKAIVSERSSSRRATEGGAGEA